MNLNHINIYIRVITSKQASDKHNGLNIQLKKCKKFIFNNKYFNNNDVYKDIGNTYKNNLRQRNKLLKPKTLIIIYSISQIKKKTLSK